MMVFDGIFVHLLCLCVLGFENCAKDAFATVLYVIGMYDLRLFGMS